MNRRKPKKSSASDWLKKNKKALASVRRGLAQARSRQFGKDPR